jgi:hypothetical protein
MARRIIAGHGYGEVAYWSDTQGHTKSTGGPWYSVSVRYLLAEQLRQDPLPQGRAASLCMASRPRRATWERLQLTMGLRARGQALNARTYLLTGLAVCSSCGKGLN